MAFFTALADLFASFFAVIPARFAALTITGRGSLGTSPPNAGWKAS
jgi:hypothetical protein